MLKKTCLAVTLLSLLNIVPAHAQQFYSNDRPASSRFTTVNFGQEKAADKASDAPVTIKTPTSV